MDDLAPVCLFTYNRLQETKKTIAALQKNFMAKESELFIFSDGPKSENEISKINTVREFLKTVDGFKKVVVYESKINKGLANSIITGVSNILNSYESIIVLEDDLIVSSNFLNFMNQSLVYYKDNSDIFSISGFSHKLKFDNQDSYDVYCKSRASSWGWATWSDRWCQINWNKNFYIDKLQSLSNREINKYGFDLSKMIYDCCENINDSWAIRFTLTQIWLDKYTIAPKISKVYNIGFGVNATHCKDSINSIKVVFDKTNNTIFNFLQHVEENSKIERQLKWQTSILFKFFYKALNYLPIKDFLIKRNNNNIMFIYEK